MSRRIFRYLEVDVKLEKVRQLLWVAALRLCWRIIVMYKVQLRQSPLTMTSTCDG